MGFILRAPAMLGQVMYLSFVAPASPKPAVKAGSPLTPSTV